MLKNPNTNLVIYGQIITFKNTVEEDFKKLHDLGTDGSVPGVDALKNQRELFNNNSGISVSIFFDDKIAGMVTLVDSGWKNCLTTSTYISHGKHSVYLSSVLKETAHTVASTQHRGFVIFVSPDNEYAQMSMKNVWPMSTPEHTDDGTLAYIARHEPHSWNSELMEYFVKIFQK